MEAIYVLTRIHLDKEKEKVVDIISSTIGWSDDFKELEDAVIKNTGDMYEYYFQYAVIEEVTKGPNLLIGKVIQWYKLDYLNKKVEVSKTNNAPFILRQRINWWS